MTKEKKKLIVMTVVSIVIAAALAAIFIIDIFKQNGTIVSKEAREIIEDFDEYYNSKSKKIIYYASSKCGYCELLTPILETVSDDYDLDYLYIDKLKLASKQRKDIINKLNIDDETPITVVVEDGEVIDTLVGYHSGQDYVEFLKGTGILEEDAEYSAESGITFVEYDEYEKLINSNSTNIITIGQTTCSHCIAIKPTLSLIANDYSITINYIDIDVLDKENYKSFNESLSKIGYDNPEFVENGQFGTPLTLIVKSGKVIDYIDGERTYSQLVREFKKHGLISE